MCWRPAPAHSCVHTCARVQWFEDAEAEVVAACKYAVGKLKVSGTASAAAAERKSSVGPSC